MKKKTLSYKQREKLYLGHQEFICSIEAFAGHMKRADLPWMARNGRFTPGMAMAFERYVEACKRFNALL